MTTIVEPNDKVESGIREWQKVRDAAQEALKLREQAEQESSYYKGQYEAIATQCKNLEGRNKQLMEENAEYKMLLSDLGRRFLDVLQNSKLSPFRAAGSQPANSLGPRNTRESLQRPVPIDTVAGSELEDSLREIVKQVNGKAKSA